MYRRSKFRGGLDGRVVVAQITALGYCAITLLCVAARDKAGGGKEGKMSGSTDSTDEMLQELSEALEHSSLHRRLAAVASAQEYCQVMPKPQARVLVRLILSALCSPQYLERLWIVRLYKVLMLLPPAMCVVNLAGEYSC